LEATLEFASEGSGGVDHAGAPFPTAATLFELSALGVLSVAAFALLAVAAVKLQRHAMSSFKLEGILAPLHAIARWRGGLT
jgi:hypothetical protein